MPDIALRYHFMWPHSCPSLLRHLKHREVRRLLKVTQLGGVEAVAKPGAGSGACAFNHHTDASTTV